MLAAHPLIGRPSLNNWAGVSGKENRLKYKMEAKLKDKRTWITTVPSIL